MKPETNKQGPDAGEKEAVVDTNAGYTGLPEFRLILVDTADKKHRFIVIDVEGWDAPKILNRVTDLIKQYGEHNVRVCTVNQISTSVKIEL